MAERDVSIIARMNLIRWQVVNRAAIRNWFTHRWLAGWLLVVRERSATLRSKVRRRLCLELPEQPSTAENPSSQVGANVKRSARYRGVIRVAGGKLAFAWMHVLYS